MKEISVKATFLAIATTCALLGPAEASAQTYAPGACTLVPNSGSCIDTTPCKPDASGLTVCLAGATLPPGALQVTQTCWQYSSQFACADATTAVNSCIPFESNPACGVISSICQDFQQPGNTCDSWTYTYQCQTAAAQTSTQLQCTNGLFDTSQYPTPSNPNNTFATAAVAMEVVREGQIYSNQGMDLFAGVSETCRKGYGGLQNCCSSAPGAKTNSAVAQVAFGAAASVVKYYGAQAVDWASPYVFDAMYNNGIWSQAMSDAFTNAGELGTSLASSGFTVGAFGFSYASAGYVPGSGLLGANESIVSFGSGNGALVFNPYVFAAVVAIMVVQEMVSCTSEEQLLSQHKGANLSVFKQEICSSKVLGPCLQYIDTYCSFNSVLAKIINTQGKAQIGMSVADCSGLSVAQIQSLDFSKIDFTEFTASIMANAQQGLPSSAAMNQSYSPVMQAITGGSAQTGVQTTNSNGTGGPPVTVLPSPNPNLPTYPGP